MKICFLSNNCNISFIENELIFLLSQEDISEVVIFTDYPMDNDKIRNNLKAKIYIYNDLSLRISRYNIVKDLILTLLLFIKEIFQNTKLYDNKFRWWSLLWTIRNEIRKARIIESNTEFNDMVFYSYWASNEALDLAILKKRDKVKYAITRLHGHDLYEENNNSGKIPFRWFILRYLDLFLPISLDGADYLTKKYPRINNRVAVSYLGSNKDGSCLNIPDINAFRIVSCGRVTSIKRHHLMFEILNTIPGIEWWHIGDGDDFAALECEVNRKSKIKIKLLGNCTQDQIKQIYQTTSFTCFLSLSVTEGIPVSMMEAISFGIPIVSNDIGGCREIVTENSGLLIPENFTKQMVVEAIIKCKNGKYSTLDGRKEIFEFWNDHFNAVTNYIRFLEQLKSLHIEKN